MNCGRLPALASALPASCQPLTQQLKGIETVTVAVVNLEYEGSILPVEVRAWSLHRSLSSRVRIPSPVRQTWWKSSLCVSGLWSSASILRGPGFTGGGLWFCSLSSAQPTYWADHQTDGTYLHAWLHVHLSDSCTALFVRCCKILFPSSLWPFPWSVYSLAGVTQTDRRTGLPGLKANSEDVCMLPYQRPLLATESYSFLRSIQQLEIIFSSISQ